MRRASNIHVVPADSGWRVAQGGRTVSRHRTQRQAITVGSRLARQRRVDLVTHARDGRIRSKDTYGREGAVRDIEH